MIFYIPLFDRKKVPGDRKREGKGVVFNAQVKSLMVIVPKKPKLYLNKKFLRKMCRKCPILKLTATCRNVLKCI
jgi:hypothetical protein